MLEFLLQTALGSRVEGRLLRGGDDLHAPHLIDVEVAQALPRLVRAGEVDDERAEEALADLIDFDLRRHPHVDLLPRAWELRDNLTAYDAMYIGLAEAFDGPLVTRDPCLGAARGWAVPVQVIG